MNENTTLKIIFLFAAFLITLSACQNMQKDIVLSGADEKTYRTLDELEKTIIMLDGAGANREELAEARRQITALEGTVADNGFKGVLAAWSGRLYLMEGKNSDAQQEYRKSQNLAPMNIPSQILSSRLERDLVKRLSAIDNSIETEGRLGELLTERGRILFDMNHFSESVAAFDSGFIVLWEKSYYADAYSTFRGKAWELRELEQGSDIRTVGIARQGEITWKDLIEITRDETDLLRFITAGRNWPAESIFGQLLERSFIPVIQNTDRTEWPFTNPSSSEKVLRSGAAWFLWRLYAEVRANRGLLTLYSSRYAYTPNARSPIPDIALSSPFLDSVLGCVESEIMSLPDGRNFMPHETVKGSDFLAMLKKF